MSSFPYYVMETNDRISNLNVLIDLILDVPIKMINQKPINFDKSMSGFLFYFVLII